MDDKELKLKVFTVLEDLVRLKTPNMQEKLADYMFFLEHFDPWAIFQANNSANLNNQDAYLLFGQKTSSNSALEAVTASIKQLIKEGIGEHAGALSLKISALEAAASDGNISVSRETTEEIEQIRQQLQDMRKERGEDSFLYHPNVLKYWAKQFVSYFVERRSMDKKEDFLPVLDDMLLLHYVTAIRNPAHRNQTSELFDQAKRYCTSNKGSVDQIDVDLQNYSGQLDNDQVLKRLAGRIKDSLQLYKTIHPSRSKESDDDGLALLNKNFGSLNDQQSLMAIIREAAETKAYQDGDLIFEELPPESRIKRRRGKQVKLKSDHDDQNGSGDDTVFEEISPVPKKKSKGVKKWLFGAIGALSLGVSIIAQEQYGVALGQRILAAVEKSDGLSYYPLENLEKIVTAKLRKEHQQLHGTMPEGTTKFKSGNGFEFAYYDMNYNLIEGNDRQLTYREIIEKYPYFLNAWVALEDKHFYEHRGVNIAASGRALGKYMVKKIVKRNGHTQGGSTLTQTIVGELRGKRNVAAMAEKWHEITEATVFEDLIRDEIQEQVNRYKTNVNGSEKNAAYHDLRSLFTEAEIKELASYASGSLINIGVKRKVLEVGFNYIAPIATADDKDFKDKDIGQYATYTEAFNAFFGSLYDKKPSNDEEAIVLEKQKMVAESFMARALRRPANHFIHTKEYVKEMSENKTLVSRKDDEADAEMGDRQKKHVAGFTNAITGTTHALHLLYQQGAIPFNFTEGEVQQTLEALIAQALIREPENNNVFHWYRETVEHDLHELGLTSTELAQAGLKVVIGYDKDATVVLTQKISEKAKKEKYKENIHIGGIVLDENGIAKAVVGDTYYHPADRAFNWVNGNHQVGAAEIQWCSTIKPLVVLNALDAGIISQGSLIYANHTIAHSRGKGKIENQSYLPDGVAINIHGTAYVRPHVLLQRSLNTAAVSLHMIAKNEFKEAYNRWFNLPEKTSHWNSVPYDADTVGIGIVETTLENIARIHNGFIGGNQKPVGEILPEAGYIVAIYDKHGNLLYNAHPETTMTLGNPKNVQAVREFQGHVFLPGGTGASSRKPDSDELFGKTGTHNKDRHAQAVLSDDEHTIAVLFYNDKTPQRGRYKHMRSADAMAIAASVLNEISPIVKQQKLHEYKEAVGWAKNVANNYSITTKQGPEGYFVDTGSDVHFYTRFGDIPEKYRTFTVLDAYGYSNGTEIVAINDKEYAASQQNSKLVNCSYNSDSGGSLSCDGALIRRGRQTYEIVKLSTDYVNLVRAERLMFYAQERSITGAADAYARVRSLMERLDTTFTPTRQYSRPRQKDLALILLD